MHGRLVIQFREFAMEGVLDDEMVAEARDLLEAHDVTVDDIDRIEFSRVTVDGEFPDWLVEMRLKRRLKGHFGAAVEDVEFLPVDETGA